MLIRAGDLETLCPCEEATQQPLSRALPSSHNLLPRHTGQLVNSIPQSAPAGLLLGPWPGAQR